MENNLRAIQDYKPIDCLLYPLKPVYISGKSEKPELVLDGQCPASKGLPEEFINTAIELSGEFLQNFKPMDLVHYVENFNKWPKTRAIKLRINPRSTGRF